MIEKYKEVISFFEKGGSINTKEAESLTLILDQHTNIVNDKHETHVFQDIALKLDTFFDEKFKVKKYFASGGIAHTNLVTRKSDNKEYIMKYLRRENRDVSEHRERFIREIINTLFVQHPNIPSLVYFGKVNAYENKDSYYYIMDYIPGEDLYEFAFEAGNKIYEKNLPKILKSYLGILEATNFLHSKEIYHRDSTLSNMIFNPKNNQSYLIDLGLSKKFNEEINITEPGTIYGNPSYIAPEAFRGNKYSVKADIYTLGSSLYSIITRQYPHNLLPDDNMQKFFSDVNKWFKEESTLNLNNIQNSSYKVFNNVIENSTAFHDNDRYNDITTFIEDYKSALEQLK